MKTTMAGIVFGYNDDLQSAKRAKIMVDRNNRIHKYFWRLPSDVIDEVLSIIKKYENEMEPGR